MSSLPPPSQTGVPQGGNGKYIAVALLLLLGIGGLVVFKMRGTDDPVKPPVTPSAQPSNTGSPISQRIDDVPPPPPDDAGVDAGPVHVVVLNGNANVCDVKVCNGATSQELENGLNMIARQTRRKCYESALGNDPTLQGHVKLNLRIASNGQVCSSSVASNDMSNTSVGDCAARTFLASHLPAPKGGCVNVDFPLAYVPAGQH